jgi:hypothetical protein
MLLRLSHRCKITGRVMPIHDEEDDEEMPSYKFSEPNDDSPDDVELSGDAQEFIRCPHCRKYILDEATQCPYCKNWVEEGGKSRKPLWILITALICVVLGILWLLSGRSWP